ncbi:MAG: isochorismatase family protein [Dehalococcoidia bacterium]|nr:isochorismatase family protein [Dehalococcoidia bacterium]
MPSYDHQTALIVVDMQNDFAHPDGSLFVQDGPAVIDVANEEIRRAANEGALVVYTQDWHPETTPHFEKDGGTWPVHCVADSWGAEFVHGLTVSGPVIQKGADGRDGYSGFSVQDPQSGARGETELSQMLKSRGITKTVVLGLAADYCVVETALDSARLGFETTVLEEGTRAVNLKQGDGDRAFERMREAGVSVE